MAKNHSPSALLRSSGIPELDLHPLLTSENSTHCIFVSVDDTVIVNSIDELRRSELWMKNIENMPS